MSTFEALIQFVSSWVTDPLVVNVFAIILATAVTSYVSKRVLTSLAGRLQATKTPWDDALLATIRRPLKLLIWVMGLSLAAELIAEAQSQSQLDVIDNVRHLAFIALVTYFLSGLIKELESAYLADGGDATTVTAIAKLVRISVFITAALMAMQTLGLSISGVLTFGGIGGIAVGFAAKDLLANFFGGLVIYLDRPFKVGDWIRSPDREIEGTVIDIGWRLTEIRTFDQRPLYIPNSMFSTISLENPSRMLNRRIFETVGIRYGDISKMSDIVSEVKTMLLEHADIDKERTLIVNFNSFSASSVDFFVYTFTKTTNWVEFHEIKQDVLLKISRIVEGHGAEIAFPTSTVHVETIQFEPQLDLEKP